MDLESIIEKKYFQLTLLIMIGAYDKLDTWDRWKDAYQFSKDCFSQYKILPFLG